MTNTIRLRIDLAYNGRHFNGWATQPNRRTVQGEIEKVLARILRDPAIDTRLNPPRLTVAGRTDAGVHASHQVCHLDVTQTQLNNCVGHMNLTPISAFQTRLSRMLPEDIAIHRVQEAPLGFDARFSALERTYVYRICDAETNWDPRQLDYVWLTDQHLDLDAMNKGAQLTLGLHDFGSFATPNPGGTTIREVKTAYWRRVPARPLLDTGQTMGEAYTPQTLESGLLIFTIVADAFARNMVRSLVNACVQLGLHKRDTTWFAEKMRTPQREGSTGPIDARGLTLEHVAYPPVEQLAERAERIRAKRTLTPEQ